ncbi:MAG: hypothetical protein MJ219_02290 [Mycoplasmoidaceae bacterium]|nr:hypothetical protein [Mycoplasmoidaceae bacterium]
MPKSYSHELVGQQIISKAKYETIKYKLKPAPTYRFESVSLTVYNAL